MTICNLRAYLTFQSIRTPARPRSWLYGDPRGPIPDGAPAAALGAAPGCTASKYE
jgi:hypothetical protein